MMAKAEEIKDKKYRERLIQSAYETACELMEGIEDHIVWRLDASSLRINGMAQIIGQCSSEKPSIRPPGVKNLYLVGDTASHAAGVGMEIAVQLFVLKK